MINHEGNLLISRGAVQTMFKNYPDASVLYVCTNDKVYTTLEEAERRASQLVDKRVAIFDRDWELCRSL